VPSVARQPLPVALGSPHCSTLMPSVTRRWHLVLSKKPLLARWVKLPAVHGTAARSIFAVIGPRLVSIVMVWVPVSCCWFAGSPTSLICLVRPSLGTSV
jgi:hypothetical protein